MNIHTIPLRTMAAMLLITFAGWTPSAYAQIPTPSNRLLDQAAQAVAEKVAAAVKAKDFGAVKRVAVYPLEGDSDRRITDVLTNAFTKTQLTVVLRERLEQVLKEHAFQIKHEDLLKKETLKRLGEILSVDAIAFGTVRESSVTGDRAVVRVDLKIANVETAELLWGELVEGTAQEGRTPPPPTANKPPEASIAAPSGGTAGAAVSFAATASDPDGQVAEYRWDFGDGKTQSGKTASIQHTYAAAGTYTVQLTVADDKGDTGAAVSKVTIAAAPAPAAPPPSNMGVIVAAIVILVVLGLIAWAMMRPGPSSEQAQAIQTGLSTDEALRNKIVRELAKAKQTLQSAQYKLQDQRQDAAVQGVKASVDVLDAFSAQVDGAKFGDARAFLAGKIPEEHLKRLLDFEQTMIALVRDVQVDADAVGAAVASGSPADASTRAGTVKQRIEDLRKKFLDREDYLRRIG